ncbi:Endonuclease/exonuclease/phosphatase, partial [Phakopsora pachyrhizi]
MNRTSRRSSSIGPKSINLRSTSGSRQLEIRSSVSSLILSASGQENQVSIELISSKAKGSTKGPYLPSTDRYTLRNISGNVYGILGLIEIESEIFLIFVNQAERLVRPDPVSGEIIYRISSVELICLTSDCLDNQPPNQFNNSNSTNQYSTSASSSSSSITATRSSDEQQQPQQSVLNSCSNLHSIHSSISGIKKILSNGQFYFSSSSHSSNLSQNTQSRFSPRSKSISSSKSSSSSSSASASSKFSWNSFILIGLLNFRSGLSERSMAEFDDQNFIIHIIQGYISDNYQLKLPIRSNSTSSHSATTPSNNYRDEDEEFERSRLMTLIKVEMSLKSRLASNRAGTRFNTRGIDDDGNVANFVETETLIKIILTNQSPSPNSETNTNSSTNHRRSHSELVEIISFVQLRGSVPLFFEQSSSTNLVNLFSNFNLISKKKTSPSINSNNSNTQTLINLTRDKTATRLSFKKHFEQIFKDHQQVMILNLLNQSRDYERVLSEAFYDQVIDLKANHKNQRDEKREDLLQSQKSEFQGEKVIDPVEGLEMMSFDLHNRSKNSIGVGLDSIRSQLIGDLRVLDTLNRFGYFDLQIRSDGNEDDHGQAGIDYKPGGDDQIFFEVDDCHDRQAGQEQPVVLNRQQGVFRTNCLDCLDRTNVIQEMLSRIQLESILLKKFNKYLSKNINAENKNSFNLFFDQLWHYHRALWADNGDVLSKIYAGTGALNTSFTRGGKQTIGGILSNATKSVSRIYNSNFIDKSKQTSIDLLLGNLNRQRPVKVFDPIRSIKNKLMNKRESEYSSSIDIKIWVGTYNLNGSSPPQSSPNNNFDESDKYYLNDHRNDYELLNWLIPFPDFEPDVMALGFQEIVKLSPQQIMITDPEKKKRWEKTIMMKLDQRFNRNDNNGLDDDSSNDEKKKKNDYIILRSEQLVGTALILIVKSNLISSIRSVEGKTKKTGLRGMTGNKGAVGIRLQIYDTSFCFVTAHFEAGQSNEVYRDEDFETIVNGLEFLKGKRIDDHDNVIWAGDFNYRINRNNFDVRSLIGEGGNGGESKEDNKVYLELLEDDQLLRRMEFGYVFKDYLEGPIRFKPTYKYDIGTDSYDSSEKMRIPAWTDRILFKGKDLTLLKYSRSELKFSDHRPVYGVFSSKVKIIDKLKKDLIRSEVLNDDEVIRVREEFLNGFQAGLLGDSN